MKNFKNLLFVALFFIAATVIGQTKISGTIVDESNEGLPGATVVVKGTTNGTETDFDGKFTLTTSSESGTIVVSYLGFKTMEIAFSGSADLGNVKLNEDGNILEEVVLRGIVDIAKDRQTPVAKSTIKAAEIQDKLGSQEFPELLNNTPSVYATKSGGGFGDSRITIRGFAQENIAVLINGVPVNDMENGKVYWSNWAGLSDVTTAMQVQRGLGSSKLAISSVGGTINIITKTTDLEEGGSVASSIGNDGYFKNLASYNTGKNENGFAASFLMSRTAGNGYVDGTEFEGFNYFVGLGWDKGDHNFQFMLTGAPQTHNQRTTSFFNMADIGDYLKYGKKYNYNHGYLNGEEFNWRKNFYHKPVSSFNWSWDINETSNLTTSAYVSFGRGGGTGDIGRMGGNFASSSNFRNPDTGLVEWDEIVRANSGLGGNFSSGYSYSNPADPSTGLQIVNDDELRDSSMPNGLERRNGFIRRASVNSHNWVGLLSNYNTKINDNLTFDVGVDIRSYKGYHYRRVDNLLGAEGYRDNDDINNPLNIQSTAYSSDLAQQWNVFRSTEDEQKINYYNIGKVRWAGAFSQLEYVSDDITAFVQVGISQQGFKRIDPFNYLDSDPERETDWQNFIGGNIKGGVNWNIDENHNVFVNMGDYSKQPFIDAVFQNFRNNINPNTRNEKVVGFEIGYGYRSEKFSANVNYYRTEWKDRFKTVGYRDGSTRGTADLQGIKQLHTGVELDFTYDLSDRFRLVGMASVGDWEYAGNVSGTAFDDLDPVGIVNLFLDGVKVGNSAQTTARLGFDWDVVGNFKVDYSHRYAARLYADINTEDFQDEVNNGSLQLPNYFLGDLGMSYKFNFKNDTDLKLRLNVNNVGNTVYLAESLTNNFIEGNDDDSYRGINTNNKAFFGFGRTWNFTMRYNF